MSILLLGCQLAESPEWPSGQIVDLTYSFNEETVYWPTAEEFELDTVFQGVTEEDFYYSAYAFSAAEHGGTHIDAPVHFAEGRPSVDEIPPERLIGPGIVIDVSEEALNDPDYQISAEDIQAWEETHGPIPDESIVLFRTGYGQFWPDRVRYMGTDERGEDAVADLHFPGLHPEAAEWLIENRSIKAVGLDTPSIDYGQSTHFETHQTLFAHDIPAFENVARLDQLPPTGSQIIALPMKIEGGSGGPLRVVAVLPE